MSDGTAKTVLGPVINLCACHNQGVCFEENDEDSSANNNTEKFKILPCVCQNGYTGSYCAGDLDACEENYQPCFPNVNCVDLPPPANASGYECGPCPSGYSGNGADCTGNELPYYPTHETHSSLRSSVWLYSNRSEIEIERSWL